MARLFGRFGLVALVLLVVAPAALAIVEPDTETEYPDTITLTAGDTSYGLKATGVGLREKTFLKVDVYTIVSYVSDAASLGANAGTELVDLDAPKQIRMDLRRSFSREKLIDALVGVIEKNYDDTSAFDADMETFQGYFTRDAQEGDVIIFTYLPGTGLTTNLNGEDKGVIANFAFTRALWTVWFGSKPADKGLKEDLLGAL
ncbi:chalcone isomerase family protein [bacterium]|nr:chalcone isomerase family protein [bacterium]